MRGNRRDEIWINANEFLKLVTPYIQRVPGVMTRINGKELTGGKRNRDLELLRSFWRGKSKIISATRAEEFLLDHDIDPHDLQDCPSYAAEWDRLKREDLL